MERRLAAILAADMVGYSRLMGEDEEETAQRLNAYRKVIDGLIAGHHGRVFGSAGDSVIAEFASPVEAVRCAVEIQRSLEERNAELPKDRRMRFRIGVNRPIRVFRVLPVLTEFADRTAGVAELAEYHRYYRDNAAGMAQFLERQK